MNLLDQIRALVDAPDTLEHAYAPATDAEGEHELEWTATRVTWRVGGVRKRQWSFDARSSTDTVRCASFAQFDITSRPPASASTSSSSSSSSSSTTTSSATFGPFAPWREPPSTQRSSSSTKPSLCICIFLSSLCHIYSSDGLDYTIHMPFPVAPKRVWQLAPTGLLLLPSSDSSDSSTSITSLLYGSSTSPTTALKSYYTLLSPFDELRPVLEIRDSPSGGGVSSSSPSSPSSPSSSSDPSLLSASSDRILRVFHTPWRKDGPPAALIVSVNVAAKVVRVLQYTTRAQAAGGQNGSHEGGGGEAISPTSAETGVAKGTMASVHGLAALTADALPGLPDAIKLPLLDEHNSSSSDPRPGPRPRSHHSSAHVGLVVREIWTAKLCDDDLEDLDNFPFCISGLKKDYLTFSCVLRSPSSPGPSPSPPTGIADSDIYTIAIIPHPHPHPTDDHSNSKLPLPTIEPVVVPHPNPIKIKDIAGVYATRAEEGMMDVLGLDSDGGLWVGTPSGSMAVGIEVISSPSSSSSSSSSSVSYEEKSTTRQQQFGRLVVRPPTTSTTPASSPSPIPIRLSHAHGHFITISYSDGSSIRVCTDLSPSSRLVRACFQVLAQLCTGSFVLGVRVAFLLRCYARDKDEDGEGGKGMGGGRGGEEGEEREFGVFGEALMEVLNKDRDGEAEGAPGTSSNLTTTSPSDSPVVDAWNKMLAHPIYARLSTDPALQSLPLPLPTFHHPLSSPPPPPPPPPPRAHHPEIMRATHALHLLGEELKMDCRRWKELGRLAGLLVRLGGAVGLDWMEYWMRGWSDSVGEWRWGDISTLISHMPPPDLIGFLHTTLGVLTTSQAYMTPALARKAYRISSPSFEYGLLLDPLPLTTSLLSIYASLKSAADLGPGTATLRAHKAALKILECGLGWSDINALPMSVAAPLLEALRTSQLNPGSGEEWGAEAYALVGRGDMARMVLGARERSLAFSEYFMPSSSSKVDEKNYETIDMIADYSRQLASVRITSMSETDPSRKNFSEVRFSEDQRLAEMDVMLDSSRIPSVRILERPDLNEHDLARELLVTVNYIIERTFAQPFGRAIYTFGSVSRITKDHYVIPPLELQVKFVPLNVTYAPDSTKILPEAKQWAEFNNAVAASLRISPDATGIDSSWIAFNKPHRDLNAEHAGFLLGLGLTGHLRALWNWHGYRYLVPKHELTSVAILLGLASSHVGEGDADITRLLTIHMRPLLPAESAELGIPLGAQSAAMMGLGLLYLGTGNSMMADGAMRELSVAHLSGGPEISNEHREAYTLTAGFAFGLIMCGLGSKMGRKTDEKHIAHLRAYMAGKALPEASATFSLTSPQNMNYVSPAATVALALMFMKTNRSDIASAFELPLDPIGLKDIQPGLLLLRALGKYLIMWDDIQPNVNWVLAQSRRMPMDPTKKTLPDGLKELYEFAFFNILSGICFAIGLKYAGTASVPATHVMFHFHDKLVENLRRQGGGGPSFKIRFFPKLTKPPAQSFESTLRRATIRDAINVVDTALALILAGTGDVSAMQRFRVRHGTFGPHVKFGSHVMTQMNHGLLFLGGGRHTLGTSNSAIACLVISLFPRYPLHSNDTRELLPAFRHLWALAVEPRCLTVRDVDTNEIIKLPLKVTLRDGPDGSTKTLPFHSPTLLPDFDKIISIKIDTPRYWNVAVNVAEDPRARENLLRTQTIYVKRRSGYLSYTDDSTGSMMMWNGASVGDPALLDYPASASTAAKASAHSPELLRSFTDMKLFSRATVTEGHLLAFADRFCQYMGKSERESVTFAYLQEAFLEALTGDRPQTIPSLMRMYRMATVKPQNNPYAAMDARDIHFTNEFYIMLFRFHGGIVDQTQKPSLLRIPALLSMMSAMTVTAEDLRKDPAFFRMFKTYALTKDLTPDSVGSSGTHLRDLFRCLTFVLAHERVPGVQALNALHRLSLISALFPDSTETSPAKLKAAAATADNDVLGAEHWPSTRVSLALALQKTAMSLSGPRTIPWTLQSIAEFLEIWFAPSPVEA